MTRPLDVAQGSSSGVSVRLATPEDNRGLLELTRSCPMEADISLSIEREPDFFALTRARGQSTTLVAEWKGGIVGCGSVSRRPAYVLGEVRSVGYIGDVKVHPRCRRSGIARNILVELARHDVRGEPVVYVGSAAAGNAPLAAMIDRLGDTAAVAKLAEFTSFQLLPFRRFRLDSTVEVRPAAVEDEVELVELLDMYFRRLTFAPVFGNGGFHETLQRSPGLSVGSYRIARRGKRLVAAVAVWDEKSLKRTRVRRMTRRLRCLSAVVRTVERVAPLPPFPAEGDLLRFVHLRHPAFADGEIGALATLVRSVVNEVTAERRHFALFTCADEDPIVRCLQGIPRTKYHYVLLAGANQPESRSQLETLRGQLCFDDAAIS